MNTITPQRQDVKRRKVTRACDDCRKKKVKCDGNQPCIHCTVYSYECTYNQPLKRAQNNSRRGSNVHISNSSLSLNNMGSEQINNELKLQRQAGTRKYNTKSSKLQAELEVYKKLFEGIFPDFPSIKDLDVPTFLQVFHNFKNNSPTFLEDVVKEYYLIANENPASLNTESTFEDALRSETNSVSSNKDDRSSNYQDQGFENNSNNSPSISQQPSVVGREIKIILPPKPIALQFVKNTWEHCCVLLRFYHRPTFIKQMDDLYETDPHFYTQNQMRFLPLCYSTMAVGALFSKSLIHDESNRDHSDEILSNNRFLQDEGYKYFIAARKLLDITNAKDLNSMQTILMMFIFLQCSARLSTCYTYIGLAMRSVLRAGFHRAIPANNNFTPLEIEMRKRLFYTIHKLDIYVNAMLGLPGSLSNEDFDQELPIDIPDECLTNEGVDYSSNNYTLSSTGIANQHTKLLMILGDIVKQLYPIKKMSNMISHETVTNLEIRLKDWLQNLPDELIPNNKNVSPQYERANKLLHLAFLHVQILLYRPFIHYISRNVIKTEEDQLSFERAKNSIRVSRTVVHLAQEMLNHNLLTGSYWYACYTIFYSVAGLLFFIHEAELPNSDNAKEYYEILNDADVGRKVLIKLKVSSMAAERTYNLLNKLFEKLNSKTILLTSMYSSPDKRSCSPPNRPEISRQSSNSIPVREHPTSNKAKFETNDETLYSSSANFNSNNSNQYSEADTLQNDYNYLKNDNSSDMAYLNDFSKAFNFDTGEMAKGHPDLMQDTFFTSDNDINTNVNTEKVDSLNRNVNIKSDPEDGIQGVFDQLDAHLFGKYLPSTNN
ncbi:Asg1p RNJ42_03247 [Nakaseomyces bracarensis]|uniref:Asg1p n=1 Tax=Nakaseomyces bracarensis TaxID=273131 RepID=UPI0038728AFC